MASPFLNKLIVITGAASGIGRATALNLARRGALLSLSDSDVGKLAAVKQEITQISTSSKPFTSTVDVRSQQALSAWIRDSLAHFRISAIYGAVNSAGVTNIPAELASKPDEATGEVVNPGPGPTREVHDRELEFVWEVNVKGTLNSLRAQLPFMQKRQDKGWMSGSPEVGGGAIVNAASVSGLMGLPGYAPYVSSKHAVIGLTRTLAKEEAGTSGVRVNAVAPAFIATPMLENVAKGLGTTLGMEMFGGSGGPTMGRLGTADEVAEVIVFLLGPGSSYMTGTVLPIDGGLFC